MSNCQPPTNPNDDHGKTMTYIITAGDNTTDLGTVGRAKTLLGATRIGRRAVRDLLPYGQGSYRVWTDDSRLIAGGKRGLSTGNKWRD
jgi:hypothetical protein